MPANWVLAAIPTGLCALAYLLTCAIERIREQRFLHAVFDGDRVQQWREDRWQARHNKRNIKRLAAHSGRRFY